MLKQELIGVDCTREVGVERIFESEFEIWVWVKNRCGSWKILNAAVVGFIGKTKAQEPGNSWYLYRMRISKIFSAGFGFRIGNDKIGDVELKFWSCS